MPTEHDPRDDAAERLEVIATDLDRAAAHCRIAAAHHRAANIPRAAAHAWAATGDVESARRGLLDASIDHAAHASTNVTE